jgi:uncharacterized protein (DUF2236 family)
MSDQGYFGSGSMTWQIASEALVNMGGCRAVLMQLAHPLVATGVIEHSRYMTDPLGRAESTFMLGQMLAFGSTRTAREAARTINRLHAYVHGNLKVAAGDYAVGTTYRAYDPELLLWVHATIVDTVLLLYSTFIRPLSWQEQNTYYQESKQIARLLGLPPSRMPQTVDDLRRYVYTMVYSNRLAATPQARRLAHQVLFPSTSAALAPLKYFNVYLTSALLPPPVRQMYDLHWGPKQQLLFETFAAGLKPIIAHLPPTLRILPVTQKLIHSGEVA